jgi:hypothetical protein
MDKVGHFHRLFKVYKIYIYIYLMRFVLKCIKNNNTWIIQKEMI